jgi:hypothetical protein
MVDGPPSQPSPAYSQRASGSSVDAPDGALYFFHLRNGDVYPDEEGMSFPSAEEAVAYGSRVAHELAESSSWAGYKVIVADANGNEIARIPILRLSDKRHR